MKGVRCISEQQR